MVGSYAFGDHLNFFIREVLLVNFSVHCLLGCILLESVMSFFD